VTVITLTNRPYCRTVASLDSRKSRNFFPGIEKKDRDFETLSSLVNIRNKFSTFSDEIEVDTPALYCTDSDCTMGASGIVQWALIVDVLVVPSSIICYTFNIFCPCRWGQRH